ncbi:Spore wall maturation protein DIT1-like protein 3 [Colletotrichum chlorophyti]|uniref:Spore wall maturation protein DIT1-like protein 3 n=1 Tax=Colletotrichum chlorophyti TaxID=708187 RepID=A0A1Q8S1G2_9PEZI|nr:Spore wall maturation protein DIT1-like protein 3 [Colletotrichum chlorophyti]
MPSVLETPARQPSPEVKAIYKVAPQIMDDEALSTAARILDIICRYRLRRPHETCPVELEGRLDFLSQIYRKVKTQSQIRMCLPAFPFKSPNVKDKVLSRLPDKAEEYALANLNGLCSAIKDVYVPGAKLTIISDGLVYNDLLGVPDNEVWAYGETLRAIAVEKGLTNIEFSRLQDLVHLPNLPNKLEEITYVANATNFRRALLNTFGRSDYDPSTEISKNEDTCLTYRGYIKFLETDLRHVYPVGEDRSKSKFKSGIEYISKQMLQRGDAFARAVRENFRDHVRLSIHPSTGENKISISPLPTSTYYTTPWHCSIAFSLSGAVTTGPRSEFENDPRYELVHEDGRPSYFREKSDLYQWKSEVTFEPQYPCGIIIRPAAGPKKLSIHDVDAHRVRALAQVNSPVIMRGFSKTKDRDLFVKKAEEFGKPLPWKFGLVLEVKDQGADTRGLNNVLSAEWMPFHFDGLFKTHKVLQEDGTEKLLPNPPKFQFFTSISPSPKDTGFTLFTPSRLVLQNLPPQLPVSRLSELTWSVSTSSFDSTKMGGLPLVISHPETGEPCLRYHEPWPQSKTAFDATNITIEGVSDEDSHEICNIVDSLLHDRRNTLYFAWEEGDLLVSDNILAMHTRSDFTAGSPREMWRIHFD